MTITKSTILTLFLALSSLNCFGQVTLSADGPGNTYNLITSVLAPGYNPIETPDCNHTNFGNHIDELWDSILGENVFRFHIHVSPDNDRCINFDRQRNEIKSYDKSPNNLKGTQGEIVEYRWRFKLPVGFQSSPNFTHIHQLKSVGGSLSSMPMYTLTTRKSNPNRLELRYAETDSQITLAQEPLASFLGHWLTVKETIQYGSYGSYSIEISKVSDSTVLFNYTNDSIVNWRSGADFVRPKWGIYRSLINSQDLRDEQVRFADFTVQELGSVAIQETHEQSIITLEPNPSNSIIKFSGLPLEHSILTVYNSVSSAITKVELINKTTYSLSVQSWPKGGYYCTLESARGIQTFRFLVN
ncbi:polysaccharide lyase [Schleiferiaceae bacterium]|nr:polysaccharide lyase [Schleiferiaceae bacterium]